MQQHMADERTFLAWIRTAIAIMGVGFLVTNLHFTVNTGLTGLGDFLANIIGIASVVLGVTTIIMVMFAYLKKTEAINNQSFRTPKYTTIFLGIFVIIIAVVFGVYFSIL
ncbi:YidH family protein [Halobacillus seohaensis]|uniref:YidH family protein n=1 Tax=Halobacillus seohaensis TaxID=447421 RepID=A0ABW2ED79_9BACI